PGGTIKSETANQDVSLQILGCPGRYREVETVYQSILENMRTQPDLQLTDIAVLVTDMNEYKPVIESIFNNPEHRIAFNLSDSTADKDSHFAMALRQLLDLADGRFTRKDVFDFLFNPFAMEAFEVTREEIEEWLQWSDALNLFSSSQGEGAPPFSWESGFHRLALGRVMETPKRGADGCLPHYRGVVPHSDLDSQDSDSLGRFIRAVDSLQADLKRFSKERLSAEVWIDRLHELIEKFVRIPLDRSEENTVRESLFYSLRDLEMLESEVGIPFAVFRQFVDGYLRNLPSQRGRFLTGGVTISSMRPLRPIPFRVIYVLGLEEGNFPGVEEDSTLDLRRRERRPGDVSTPEANRYLFLETLMVAGEKLYLTYPNRDLQKDREIAPCSVVEELKRVAECRLGGKEFEELSLPISSASREYLRPSPEWTDAKVNLSSRDRFLCLLALKGEGQLHDEAQETLRNWIKERFEDLPEFQPGEGVEEEKISVRLSQLKSFLVNPLEAAIKFQLGLSDEDEEDPGLKENEPFLSAFPSDYQILVETLQSTLGEDSVISPDENSFLSNLYEGLAICGETPSGVFGNLDREGFEEAVLDLMGDEGKGFGLASFLQQLGGAEFFQLLQIGESDAWVERTMELPPVPFSVETAGKKWEVELHGDLPFVWRNEERMIALTLAPTSSCQNAHPSKHLLTPFLFYLSLLASEAKGGESLVGHRDLVAGVLFKDGIRLWKFFFTPEQAGSYLQSLLVDFLSPSSFGKLPLAAFSDLSKQDFKAVIEILNHPSPDMEAQNLFEEILLDAIEREESGMFHRGMELADMLETGLTDNALETAQRRLLPFLMGEPMDSLEAVE
ncbi:MAG: exodeoxyribonuclease V subunit gamma, partial [Candidatus Omnitrophica bacterium]|nr:exodeoxyribonuclease V subunit gamma [Candidatus Omnitrophota bacterium]